ncbi:acyl-homoserine-lactone synthase [Pseudovibrio sp. Ad26]|uniref:acyl-homoserine-lactone synthase n=1 Tax=Pseudovibrio sp. Ad26 TaxID=989410 RepID=UPI0007AEE4FA|nr:acyl-homoserine-lactone synthase [Pseudovibrio sp. Ad26]KZK99170.1 Autoinducer synthetase [Pseudovibrio sp. Ad26]
MQSTCLSFETIHKHGDLWLQHLKLRKALFVDQMGWKIPHNNLIEWDEYDTGNTRYVISHKDGKVVAASRFNPCNHDACGRSYMIRDAQLGRLSNFPNLKIDALPTDTVTYEATRFTTDPLLSKHDRSRALEHNALSLAEAAQELGASRLIALMHPGFARWLSRIGLATHPIGPTVEGSDGDKICVLEMNLKNL